MTTNDLTVRAEGGDVKGVDPIDDDIFAEMIAAPVVIEVAESTLFTREQLTELRNSGLTEADAVAAGIYSADWKVSSDLLGHTLLAEENAPSLVIPYWIPQEGEDPVLNRLKLAKPFKDAKYLSPKGAAPRLYLTPRAREVESLRTDARFPLIIVEGEKKTLAASKALQGITPHEYCVVGIAGCTGWSVKRGKSRKLLTEFNLFNLKDRRVVICLDGDVASKKLVSDERRLLSVELAKKGAKVFWAKLPDVKGAKVGLDDYYVAEGSKRTQNVIKTSIAYQPVKDPVNDQVRETQIQLADYLADSIHHRCRFVIELEGWIKWDGKYWSPEHDGEMVNITKQFLNNCLVKAKEMDEKGYEALIKANSTNHGTRNLLALARVNPKISVSLKDIDKHKHLIVCSNGVVDLRDGSLGSFDPALMLTRMSPTAYVPGATSAEFQQVFERLVPDAEVRAYFHKCVGYSITGETSADALFLMVGEERSGKSTLMEGIHSAMGSGYFGQFALKSFCQDNSSSANAARSDLVAMVGKRTVFSMEVSKGHKLNQGLLKQITGGDGKQMPLRSENGKTAPMDLTAKIWIVCNVGDFPRADTDDAGFLARLVRLPLAGRIPEAERKPEMRALFGSSPAVHQAILAWAVKGATLWYSGGLGVRPQAVLDANEELADDIGGHPMEWVKGNLVFGDSQNCEPKALYDAYTQDAKDFGHHPMSMRSLLGLIKSEASKVGVRVRRSTRGTGVKYDSHKVYCGVDLRVEKNDLDRFAEPAVNTDDLLEDIQGPSEPKKVKPN